MKIPKLRPSVAPPILFETSDGKRYIVPHWIEVDETVTREQVQKAWVPFKSGKEVILPKTDTKEFSIANSKGDGFYTVKYERTQWSCTCPAFSFRRRCKHIEQAKTQIV